jgi:hypothetical protein
MEKEKSLTDEYDEGVTALKRVVLSIALSKPSLFVTLKTN